MPKFKKTSILTIGLRIAFCSFPTLAFGATWYVWDSKGSDQTACNQNFSNPCKSISGAINQAASGDSIYVAAGTYTENIVIIFKDLSLYGGFTGTETQGLSQRVLGASNQSFVHPAASGATFDLLPATALGIRIDGFTIEENNDYFGITSGLALIIANNKIQLNQGQPTSGGCDVGPGSHVYNNIFSQNFPWGLKVGNNSQVDNNVFSKNTAGMYYLNASTVKLLNNSFSDNTTGSLVSPQEVGSDSWVVENNTFVNSTAGPGIQGVHTNWTVKNNLFDQNQGGNAPGITLDTSNAQLNVNPLTIFKNNSTGDLSLQDNSPAIDAGDDSVVQTNETDITGYLDATTHKRISGSHVDIGAYEYQSHVSNGIGPLYVSNKALPNGSPWTNVYSTIQAAVNAASPGNIIWVAGGGPSYTDQFTISKSILLYGGFAGTESLLTDRVLGSHETVLDGTAQGSITLAPPDLQPITLDGFTFTHNTGLADGALGVTTISHNIFRSVLWNGGNGIYVQNGSPQILYNQFLSNTFGLYTLQMAGARISDNIFSSTPGSRALFDTGSNGITITNNTLVNSDIASPSSIAKGWNLENNILSSSIISAPTNANCSATYNLFYGNGTNKDTGFTLNHNITGQDPKLNADFTLQNNSPAINAGDNSVITDGETDIAGNPRILDIVDLGAYELKSSVNAPSLSPAPGTYSSQVSVTITGDTGTKIKYSEDGGTTWKMASDNKPTISITHTETLLAIAVDSGGIESGITQGLYTVPATRYVSNKTLPNGSPWTNVYPTIQAAVNAAQPGDQIWVAGGGPSYTDQFTISKSVSLYGGFAGSESQLTDRVLGTHETVLDGTAQGPLTLAPPELQPMTIDGFTFTHNTGLSDGALGVTTISHNIFRSVLWSSGNGLYIQNGSPQILYNQFLSNAYGLFTLQMAGARIADNLFSSTPGSRALFDTGSNGITITNNTLVNSDLASPTSLAKSWNIENNIFSSSIISTPSNANCSATYNLFYGNGTNVDTGFILNHNITGQDPKLNNDFTLQNNSPAINKGDDTAVLSSETLDLAGKPRKVGVVDMGAYENQSSGTGSLPTISLTKSVLPLGIVTSGDTLTYTITYQNTGSADANNVVIQDSIPTGTLYKAGTLSGIGCTPPSQNTPSWSCAVGTVVAGAQAQTISFDVLTQ